MFAPKPFDVAREMVRVTKPGGTIVMGNWIPNDPTFVSQLLKISSAFTPPPPEGFVSPMLWGVESHVIERFDQAGVPKEKVSMAKDTYYFVSASQGPADFISRFLAILWPHHERLRSRGTEGDGRRASQSTAGPSESTQQEHE